LASRSSSLASVVAGVVLAIVVVGLVSIAWRESRAPHTTPATSVAPQPATPAGATSRPWMGGGWLPGAPTTTAVQGAPSGGGKVELEIAGGGLPAFKSWRDVEEYIKAFRQTPSLPKGVAIPLATPVPATFTTAGVEAVLGSLAGVLRSAPSYSTTNVQVAGVDEADVVKTDGYWVYVLNSSGYLRVYRARPAENLSLEWSLDLCSYIRSLNTSAEVTLRVGYGLGLPPNATFYTWETKRGKVNGGLLMQIGLRLHLMQQRCYL